MFILVVRERVSAPNDWSPLTLFLAGVQLQRPDVCADALERQRRPWRECSGPKIPNGVARTFDTLDPLGFSYNIFSQIPSQPLLALSQARRASPPSTVALVAPHLPPMSPRQRFLHNFESCSARDRQEEQERLR